MAKYSRKAERVLDPVVVAIEASLRRYKSYGLKPGSLVTESEIYYIDTVGRRPSKVPKDAKKMPLEQIVAFRVRTYEEETGMDFPKSILKRNGWNRSNIYGYGLPELKLVPKEEPLELRVGIDDDIDLHLDEVGSPVDYVGRYLSEIGKAEYAPLSPNQEYEVACRVRQGDFHARDELTNHNLRLVVSIAKNYKFRHDDFMEVIQWGNEGLLKAVVRFDPYLGWKFSTYASWWIKQSIRRSIVNNHPGIRLPVQTVQEMSSLRNLYNQYEGRYNRRPTPQEISKDLKWSMDAVERVIIANEMKQIPIGTEDREGESNYFDFADETSVTDDVDVADQLSKLRKLFDECLNSGERRILERRSLGFTLEEIGKEFKLTRERIRQIAAKAKGKLRDRLKIEPLPERMWDW